MATNQTTNYQLNQWEPTDPVLRTDFNADNAKLDAALEGKADADEVEILSNAVSGLESKGTLLETAIAQCGNCTLVYGTYTGTGMSGSTYPNTLTFEGKPFLVFIFTQSGGRMLLLGNPCKSGFWANSDGFRFASVTWSESGVSWYHTYSDEQMNNSGLTYSYVALLTVEA